MKLRDIVICDVGKAATFSGNLILTKDVILPKIVRMKISWILSAIVAASFLAGCNLKEKYARNNFAADQWLQASIGRASVNVTGAWEAEESGWGDIRFEQIGSSVNGAMGNYSVRGVIRGSQVFLALRSGGYVYYTAVLKKNGEMLSGFYSSSVPFRHGDEAAVTLRRIGP
ncbi:MAG TPA: hypothetical protein VIS99_01950 [Terrimicrobiaceae bacterium]